MGDINLSNSRPMLKKVKRPINRLPQQPVMPTSNIIPEEDAVSLQPQSTSKPLQNPFNNQEKTPSTSTDISEDFNLDSILDENLVPSINNTGNTAPLFLEDESEISTVYKKAPTSLPEYITRNTLIMICIICLLLGAICGKFLFTESKVVRNGLQGVVLNPEVPRGRARCGVAERSQGCVLYVMNPQRQELNARDFYDLASQMTGRQRFVIETGNMRYSNTKIRPGDIVQLNIPPL